MSFLKSFISFKRDVVDTVYDGITAPRTSVSDWIRSLELTSLRPPYVCVYKYIYIEGESELHLMGVILFDQTELES